MAACVRMSEMMWEKVLGEGGLRDSLGLLAEGQPGRRLDRPQATVLSFDSAQRQRPRPLS